jgi:hypothetical protein
VAAFFTFERDFMRSFAIPLLSRRPFFGREQCPKATNWHADFAGTGAGGAPSSSPGRIPVTLPAWRNASEAPSTLRRDRRLDALE